MVCRKVVKTALAVFAALPTISISAWADPLDESLNKPTTPPERSSTAETAAPHTAAADTAAAVPTISGASVYLMGTPQMDTESLKPTQETLKGTVSDSGTASVAAGKLQLPEMDCVGFAGQASVAGGAQLKGLAEAGKPGYHTDGGAWMIVGDYPVMVSVFDGDSCQRQGMQPGDVILELNGCSTYKLGHDSILNLFRSWDANMRNHYTLKRGNQVFRLVTQITWHPFGSGSYEESLWKKTWRSYKY